LSSSLSHILVGLRAVQRMAAQPRAAFTVLPVSGSGHPARRLQRLVRRRAGLYIESMNAAFELPPAQAEKLRQAAEQFGISPSELARAAVADLLAERDDEFQKAAERVLRKNADLYRRLA